MSCCENNEGVAKCFTQARAHEAASQKQCSIFSRVSVAPSYPRSVFHDLLSTLLCKMKYNVNGNLCSYGNLSYCNFNVRIAKLSVYLIMTGLVYQSSTGPSIIQCAPLQLSPYVQGNINNPSTKCLYLSHIGKFALRQHHIQCKKNLKKNKWFKIKKETK